MGTEWLFSAAATTATATATTAIRFSKFSLGRKSSVVRCKRDSKNRRFCTTSFWFEIGALRQISFVIPYTNIR